MIARIVFALLLLGSSVIDATLAVAAETPPPPPGAPGPPGEAPGAEAAPARISYLYGQVSFWRPGAEGWTPAVLNTPLAPGDTLYTGSDGTVEIQVGPRAFVRAAAGTQLGLDNLEPDYLQLRVTTGYAGIDLRGLPQGQTVEVDTPNAAFTIDHVGYYRVDVDPDSTALATYRGGTATMTLPNGNASRITAGQQVIVTGTDSPQLAVGATPALTAWDRWGYQRSDYMVQAASQHYVAPAVYGAEALDRYGSWRTVETYGPVWVPAGVPAGWVPYSTGRWIWDPRFGWTWLDDAPWGWAPYHYGRWVYLGGLWAWAPGPIIVRPVYAPALVVFLGGATVTVGRPICWAPLAWGEPVVPWWGRPGFIGVPWWGGWGGPHVVNNVVVNQTTTVNVKNITVYKNVSVTNAVVGVPVEHFGQGQTQPKPVAQNQVQQLAPVAGPVPVKPGPASVAPSGGSAPAPPATVHTRTVVATRTPQQGMPTPQQQGISTTAPTPLPAPKIVPAPKPGTTPPAAASLPPGPSPAPGTPSAPAMKPPVSTQTKTGGPPPMPSPAPSGGQGSVSPPAGGSPSAPVPKTATAPASAPSTGSPHAPPPKSVATPAPAPPMGAPSAPSPRPPTSHPPPAAVPPSPSSPPGQPMPSPTVPPKPPQSGQSAPIPPSVSQPAPKTPPQRAEKPGGQPPPHGKSAATPPPPPAERPTRAPGHPHEPQSQQERK